ncbi:MAG: hypothetical protein US20_C0002G0005 [Candidatus Pacebacteria bacterium GW2011_GWF1_36_5]|nr:MAG: hypothetical protein US20_C0002G0005 [Candidatus Pacebacteria bacterium GW2011_GWF1_36_5]
MNDTCYLDVDKKWNQCCCKCVHHLPTHLSCGNVVSQGDHKCVCDIQIGWACTIEMVMVEKGEIPRIQINWPEHSCGCEMYEKRSDT